jgi:outer membrane protein OmpA-like peptidoglycan-associated protein
MNRCLFAAILYMLPLCAEGQKNADTVHIYFDLDKPGLNSTAKATIDSLLYYDVISNNKNILIIGYADYLGTDEHNKTLSENRAKNIRDYLTVMNITPQYITLCIGKGEITRNSTAAGGFAPDRKVDIVIPRYASAKARTESKPPLPDKPKTKLETTFESLKVGQTFVLDNIYFYSGRHTIRKESLPELDNLISILKTYPSLKIKIEGHVCCVPSDKDALDEDVMETIASNNDEYGLNSLSVNRAIYIYRYLASKGIARERLQFAGYGKTRPLVSPETTLEAENKNRRVEIRILEK